MFEKIIAKIQEYSTIIVHRHQRPDGDCIGSQAGLVHLLKESFPEKIIYSVGDDIPDYLKFIGLSDIISDDIYKEALVIVVDTSVKSRIYDERYQLAKFLIKIDHHDNSEPFREDNYLEYIDPNSAACAGIITRIYEENQDLLHLSKNSAMALYTGIVTDTGRFQYRGVDGNILRAASKLLDQDIDIEYIYSKLNLKDISSYKLEAYVYKHMQSTKSGVVYIFFTKAIMKKFGVSKEDAAALVNTLSSIKGSLIWVTFVDYDENIRVRLRSRYVAINEIATHYRGGGHLQASGATIYNKNEMRSILKELDLLHEKFKKEHQGLE